MAASDLDLWKVASASLNNASDLLKAAALLGNNNFYGFASFMAVACLDEIGKAFSYHNIGEGTLPKGAVDIRDHKDKIEMALVLRDLHRELQHGASLENQAWAALLGWIRRNDSPELLHYLHNPDDGASRELAIKSLVETLKHDPPWIPMSSSKYTSELRGDTLRELVATRGRGLYADFPQGKVRTPRHITEQDFLRVFEQASKALEMAEMSMGSEDSWSKAILDLAINLLGAAGTIEFKLLYD